MVCRDKPSQSLLLKVVCKVSRSPDGLLCAAAMPSTTFPSLPGVRRASDNDIFVPGDHGAAGCLYGG